MENSTSKPDVEWNVQSMSSFLHTPAFPTTTSIGEEQTRTEQIKRRKMALYIILVARVTELLGLEKKKAVAQDRHSPISATNLKRLAIIDGSTFFRVKFD
jgi:hypothetical protein